MTEELLDKALDNRRRAEGKRRIASDLLSQISKLASDTPSSIGGWKEFDLALCNLNNFNPDIRRPILDKMADVLREGLTDLSKRLNEEAEELDREFENL